MTLKAKENKPERLQETSSPEFKSFVNSLFHHKYWYHDPELLKLLLSIDPGGSINTARSLTQDDMMFLSFPIFFFLLPEQSALREKKNPQKTLKRKKANPTSLLQESIYLKCNNKLYPIRVKINTATVLPYFWETPLFYFILILQDCFALTPHQPHKSLVQCSH